MCHFPMGCGGLIAPSSTPEADGGWMELALYYVWWLHPAGLSESIIAANIKDLLPAVCQNWQYKKMKTRNDLLFIQRPTQGV